MMKKRCKTEKEKTKKRKVEPKEKLQGCKRDENLRKRLKREKKKYPR